ncbi:hypothetical protein MKW92_031031 [Papaver armeniacum]|nr:hypothetical protein MKW92_031031 [Papaver armeniacum]
MAEWNPTEPAKRTNVASDWLQRVQALECLQTRKLVSRKQIVVERLSSEGDFRDVTYRCEPDPFQEIPVVKVVGMDVKFNEVLESLVPEENLVQVVGLHGMGGVGKTTLLQKVNNEFTERKNFDVVIWVVVSKCLNLTSIQNQIGKKVGLSWSEGTETYERANDIFKRLKNRRFLLLLDDIWDGIDLETIGVSRNAIQLTGSKVVFSTRSEQVCGLMEADRKIKIECLDEDQAWSLFQQKVKQEALSCHPDVLEVAKKVAKECRGLPLALITIGRTMSSKTDLKQWQHALCTLQESASQYSGMADKVLAILKYSYDSLESQKLKSCFLYCSLHPEDFSISIDGLIGCWLGEGFLENVDDLVKALNEGLDVIRCLKDACLLETGIMFGVKVEAKVKMHDVVRDMAIWVASTLGEKKGTYLTVQAQSTLKLHELEKAERVSLVGNTAITKLNGAPHCSKLLTMLLQNSNVSDISDDFFRFMPMLKVLNLNAVRLKKLPTSIFSLSKLEYLELPLYDEDVVLPPGSLASLTKLKAISLSRSCFHWEFDGGPSLGELEGLQHLIGLQITIGTGVALQRLVTSQKLQLCTKLLSIKYCPGITSLTFLPPASVSVLSLVHMTSLSFLSLENCDELEELRIISCDAVTLFTTLEELHLLFMPKLRIVWDVPQQSFFSVSLKRVIITGCPGLKDITWLIYIQNLELLRLVEMDGLEDIISSGFAAEQKLITTFSRLSLLSLHSLKNLRRICDQNVKFFRLENILVVGCPKLKKLPFNTNSLIPRSLKKIEGEEQWWERLEWGDEATKSKFNSYFVTH